VADGKKKGGSVDQKRGGPKDKVVAHDLKERKRVYGSAGGEGSTKRGEIKTCGIARHGREMHLKRRTKGKDFLSGRSERFLGKKGGGNHEKE